MKRRINVVLVIFSLYALRSTLHGSEFPRGFFVEDLRQTPPVPAFYDLETHKLERFAFRQAYFDFIDVAWDREKGRVFFSARQTKADPYRVYLKTWPNGEEKVIYENPIGPFRFLLAPDGRSFVVQVMGPSAWPILAVHEWENARTTLLGQGFSPDWSSDGKRLLFLQIPQSLPSWLAEFNVALATSTVILSEPVTEAMYGDSADWIVLKTAKQSNLCDEFQLWDRRKDSLVPFSVSRQKTKARRCASQREMNAFPGHEFLFFKESPSAVNLDEQTMVITDAFGGRLQTLSREEWDPKATAVELATLAIGDNPLFVMSADGAGGKVEVPQARFIRYKK